MAVHEKEALEPFLNQDDSSSSRDGSLELPEINTKLDYHRENHDETPPTSPSEPFEFEESTTLSHKSPVKRSATYAIAFMLGAQVFSASMNVSIRLLENASTHLHPLQVSLTTSFAVAIAEPARNHCADPSASPHYRFSLFV